MTDGYVTTQGELRVMFPRLFNPKAPSPGKDPQYSLLAIVRKDSPTYNQIRDAVQAVATDSFGTTTLPTGRGNPLKDCATADVVRKAEGKEPLFNKLTDPENYCYFNATTRSKPGVVDAELNDLIAKDSVKDGYWCRLNVNAWTWSHSGVKGVSIGLNHVQVVREDERLASGGGSSDPRNVFAPVAKALASDETLLDGNEFE